jgi:hypothetical protein
MNTPAKSKINYTALLMAVVGILVGLDIIPPEIEEPVVQGGANRWPRVDCGLSHVVHMRIDWGALLLVVGVVAVLVYVVVT